MRIVPMMNSFKSRSAIKNTINSTKLNNANNTNTVRKYTGNASTDLAYASMFDENIAQDLKSMGLIG